MVAGLARIPAPRHAWALRDGAPWGSCATSRVRIHRHATRTIQHTHLVLYPGRVYTYDVKNLTPRAVVDHLGLQAGSADEGDCWGSWHGPGSWNRRGKNR